MICRKCNSEIRDDSKFCSKCGTKCNTITTDNSKPNKRMQPAKNHRAFMISLIMSFIGGLIAYLSVFHDAFGSASGFMAVIGAFVLLIGIILFLRAIGVPDEVIIEALDKANREADRKREIRRANHIWNDAQRDYDRYNHSIKK